MTGPFVLLSCAVLLRSRTSPDILVRALAGVRLAHVPAFVACDSPCFAADGLPLYVLSQCSLLYSRRTVLGFVYPVSQHAKKERLCGCWEVAIQYVKLVSRFNRQLQGPLYDVLI